MGKITLLVGAGVGYVLGTRAGREQYDKLAEQAQRLWRDPRVQDKAQQAQSTATDLGHKAQEKVSEKVQERTGDSSSASGGGSVGDGPSTPGQPSAGGPGA